MPRGLIDVPVDGAQGPPPLVSPAGRWERRGVMGVGMVGACALGVAVGVWARPHQDGVPTRQMAAQEGPTAGRLRILLTPEPAPASAKPVRIAASPEPVRVLSQPPVALAVRAPAPAAPQAAKPSPVVVARTEGAEKPVAKPGTKARTEPTRLAGASKPSKAELATAERDKAAKARLAWLAKVERMKAAERERAAKAAFAKVDKARAAKALKLAKAATSAKAAPARLAAARPAPHPVAVNAPASTLDVQLAALRAEPLKVSAPVPKALPPAPARPATRACDADSRAEALLCADPKLAAADRRLGAAYRRAIQAGAPPDRLRRQQGRWLAAREAAAEEAPWAVGQVYEARISELEDEAARAAEE
jgi:uncharacterized protein YecT (DUF1311 family)